MKQEVSRYLKSMQKKSRIKMAYDKKVKTEHGHREDMAGKSWDGRKEDKAASKPYRRILDKQAVEAEIAEMLDEQEAV